MAPPDNEEVISLLSEALKKLSWKPDEPVQSGGATSFHRYMNLPAELREQIRIEAFKQEESSKQFAACAAVCKEWQPIVESSLFKSIRINPLNEQDVSMFKTVFTKESRRWILEHLVVIIDDRKTGPWHSTGGLLEISLFVQKLGQILHFISAWPRYEEFEIRFVSLSAFDPDEGYFRNAYQTTSLWTESQLNRATKSGIFPTEMPLWAIKSDFPASLEVGDILKLPIDCLPLPATLAIVQRMPKLLIGDFDLTFEMKSAEGIERLADFIDRLPILAPNLSTLRITNSDKTFAPDTVTESMRRLTISLRDYSRELSYLTVSNLRLHQSFFEPFVDEHEFDTAQSDWKWPYLEGLEISCGTFGAYAGPGVSSRTPVELLMAAGRATKTMPDLSVLDIKILEGPTGQWEKSLDFYRDLHVWSNKPERSTASLQGFDRDEDEQILVTFEPSMGAKARFVSQDFPDPDSDEDSSDYDEDDEDDEGDEDDEDDEDNTALYEPPTREYEAVP